MNRLLRHSLAAATLGAVLSLPALAADPGEADFGSFSAADGCKFVEVNLQSGLIKFAAKIAASS